jgi:hypothetical protein
MLLNRTFYFNIGGNINKQIDFITLRINNKDDSYPKKVT